MSRLHGPSAFDALVGSKSLLLLPLHLQQIDSGWCRTTGHTPDGCPGNFVERHDVTLAIALSTGLGLLLDRRLLSAHACYTSRPLTRV